MVIAHLIRQLTGPRAEERELSEGQAHNLLAALLDHGVPELEIGALLAMLAARPLAATEMAGLRRAAQERVNRLPLPPIAGAARPVVIPSYGGALHHPNLMPLVALALAGFGIPTLVHGTLDSDTGVPSSQVFRALGVLPCASAGEAQRALEERHIAFIPTTLIAPALRQLIALRARLGAANCAQLVAGLLDPFDGKALKLVPASNVATRDSFAAVFAGHDEHALLFVGTEGEAYPTPRQRPAIEYVRSQVRERLFDAEPSPLPERASQLPDGVDAKGTARWIERALDGAVALPQPIVNLLACCLYAAGYTEDFSQSKAIVAVRIHTHAGV